MKLFDNFRLVIKKIITQFTLYITSSQAQDFLIIVVYRKVREINVAFYSPGGSRVGGLMEILVGIENVF